LIVCMTRVRSVTLSLLAISVEGLACLAPETHYVLCFCSKWNTPVL